MPVAFSIFCSSKRVVDAALWDVDFLLQLVLAEVSPTDTVLL